MRSRSIKVSPVAATATAMFSETTTTTTTTSVSATAGTTGTTVSATVPAVRYPAGQPPGAPPVYTSAGATSAAPATNPAAPRRAGSVTVSAEAATLAERLAGSAAGRLPLGLQEQFAAACRLFAKRFFIVDNSGSMGATDGKRVEARADGEAMVTCSRWDELGQSLEFHAEVAARCQAPAEFRLLNPPFDGAPQVYEAGVGRCPEHDVAAVERMCESEPTGKTPLCAQIRAVSAQVAEMAAELERTGQRVFVCIASDGLATDGDQSAVTKSIRAFKRLPVWVVIRLCTSDDAVVRYWNSIEAELEATMEFDVLDDLRSEAVEVNRRNGWLTYGAGIHRLREWGTAVRCFDWLEEKPLSSTEIQKMGRLIYGSAAGRELPNPEADVDGFRAALTRLEADRGPTAGTFDPVAMRNEPWLKIDVLQAKYAPAPPRPASVPPRRRGRPSEGSQARAAAPPPAAVRPRKPKRNWLGC